MTAPCTRGRYFSLYNNAGYQQSIAKKKKKEKLKDLGKNDWKNSLWPNKLANLLRFYKHVSENKLTKMNFKMSFLTFCWSLHFCWRQIVLLFKQNEGIYGPMEEGQAWWVIKLSPAFQERRADPGGANSFQLKISTEDRGTTSAEEERGKRGADQGGQEKLRSIRGNSGLQHLERSSGRFWTLKKHRKLATQSSPTPPINFLPPTNSPYSLKRQKNAKSGPKHQVD